MKLNLSFYFQLILSTLMIVNNVRSDAVQLNVNNFDSVIGGTKFAFVNFYAGWCRFSNMLEPIWNQFADKISQNHIASDVVIAKVDAEVEKQLAMNNGINKYPTLKMFRYGVLVKKEYRGARNVEAFESFLKDQLSSKLKFVETIPDLMALSSEKSTIIGYFENKESAGYQTFLKLTDILRDKCEFVAAIGTAFGNDRLNGDKIVYSKSGIRGLHMRSSEEVKEFIGQVTDYNTLYTWAFEICTPLVRTITFENAEELTEGGLPFLIIFHKTGDTESIKIFEDEIKRQLVHGGLNTVQPVAADGGLFSHPLTHLGKTINDLPVIAIDSFKHMYLFPNDKKYTDGDNLKEFVMDLNSGKLHREFHNGPDPLGIGALPNVQFEIVINPNDHIPKLPEKKVEKKQTGPPESSFIKLAPSSDRYSPLRHGDGGEF